MKNKKQIIYLINKCITHLLNNLIIILIVIILIVIILIVIILYLIFISKRSTYQLTLTVVCFTNNNIFTFKQLLTDISC